MRKYIEELRARKNMTQQEVADSLGCSRQLIQAIESGRRIQDGLTTNMIGKLARTFGVPAEEIYRMEAAYQAERAAMRAKQGLE